MSHEENNLITPNIMRHPEPVFPNHVRTLEWLLGNRANRVQPDKRKAISTEGFRKLIFEYTKACMMLIPSTHSIRANPELPITIALHKYEPFSNSRTHAESISVDFIVLPEGHSFYSCCYGKIPLNNFASVTRLIPSIIAAVRISILSEEARWNVLSNASIRILCNRLFISSRVHI